MKQNAKKVLSIVTAIMMLLPMLSIGAFAAEVADLTVDANDLTINPTHTGITNLPDGISMGMAVPAADIDESKGGMKAYKLTDVLGLSGGEAAIEFVARESRVNAPRFEMVGQSFEIGEDDFYITTNIYIGDARDEDIYQIGTRYTNVDNENSTALLFFTGDGRIVKTYSKQAKDAQQGGVYQPNNWYRFTIAVTDGAVTAYLDDEMLNGKNNNISVSNNIANMNANAAIEYFGIRLRSWTDTTEFSGLPQWFAVKDMKLVKGTYDSTATSTDISTTAYTYAANSILFGGTSTCSATDAVSEITGVNDNTTVEDFLANITVPTGASKQVVTINDDDKKTTVIGNDSIVTSDMKLLVTSQDGSMKLYDIVVTLDSSKLPSITSTDTSAYVIDTENKTITIPDTTVAKLKEHITSTNGTVDSVVDVNGNAVDDAKSVNATMKLLASNNGVTDEYTLLITNNTSFFTRMADYSLYANNIDNPAKPVLKYTYSSETAKWTAMTTNEGAMHGGGKVPLFGGSDGSSSLVYSYNTSNQAVIPENGATYTLGVSKMPESEAIALKTSFVGHGGWSVHNMNKRVQETKSSSTYTPKATRDKTIINYKLYLEQGAAAMLNLAHYTGGFGSSNQTMGDNLCFINNNIYMGSSLGTTALTVGTDIGNFEYETEYDITIVEKTPASNNTTEEVQIEAIWISYKNADGETVTTNLLSDGATGTAERYPTGLYQFMLYSLGTVYWGDINIYMADDYNPLKETTVTEEADLTITSESLTIDAVNNRIYGWENAKTVADLKDMIDSKLETKLEVLDVTGRTALTPSASVDINMFVKISDVNYPENAAYYILTKNTEDTQTSLVHDVNKSVMKASRSIRVYNAESAEANKTLLYAAYDASGALEVVKSVTHTIQNPGDYNFDIELPYNEDWTYKAFFWNMTNLVPYEAAK